MKITVGIKEIKLAVALTRTQIYPVAYGKKTADWAYEESVKIADNVRQVDAMGNDGKATLAMETACGLKVRSCIYTVVLLAIDNSSLQKSY